MNIVVFVAFVCAIPSPSDYYSAPHKPAAASDYYTPSPPKPSLKEEEEDDVVSEKPVTIVDRRRVIVYLDLRDIPSVRRVVDELDRVQGLEFVLKDKSEVPDEGRRFALPLFHFSAGPSKWGFRSGWFGPDEFAAYWNRYNPDENQGLRIGKSKARSTQPQLQRSGGGGYRAHSYEWHLTSGESANSLRNHLAVQQPEHQRGAYFSRAWLNTLSFHELVGLHSDAHNHRVSWGQIRRQSACGRQSSMQQDQLALVTDPMPVMTEKEVKKAVKSLGRIVYGTRDGKHPGPVGSSIRGFFGDPRYSRSMGGCPNGMCPR